MKAWSLKPVGFTISEPAPKRTNGECGSANCEFCEFCESRPGKGGGASDRYRCVECGRRFTHRPGFPGRHYGDAATPGAIGGATGGKSLGAAARSATKNSQSGSAPARSTEMRRMQRAKSTTAKISENAPAGVGGRRNADETRFPADKGGRYMADVMDAEIRVHARKRDVYGDG